MTVKQEHSEIDSGIMNKIKLGLDEIKNQDLEEDLQIIMEIETLVKNYISLFSNFLINWLSYFYKK